MAKRTWSREANDPIKKTDIVNGVIIPIEWQAGETRTWPGSDYSRLMSADYGYVRSTEGEDGEELDVYVGPDLDSDQVFAIKQLKDDGSFDEMKYMVGYDSQDEAETSFCLHMKPEQMGEVDPMSFDEFKQLMPPEAIAKDIQRESHMIRIGDLVKIASKDRFYIGRVKVVYANTMAKIKLVEGEVTVGVEECIPLRIKFAGMEQNENYLDQQIMMLKEDENGAEDDYDESAIADRIEELTNELDKVHEKQAYDVSFFGGKKEVKIAKMGKCDNCDQTASVHIYHADPENMGDSPDDVTTLCSRCAEQMIGPNYRGSVVASAQSKSDADKMLEEGTDKVKRSPASTEVSEEADDSLDREYRRQGFPGEGVEREIVLSEDIHQGFKRGDRVRDVSQPGVEEDGVIDFFGNGVDGLEAMVHFDDGGYGYVDVKHLKKVSSKKTAGQGDSKLTSQVTEELMYAFDSLMSEGLSEREVVNKLIDEGFSPISVRTLMNAKGKTGSKKTAASGKCDSCGNYASLTGEYGNQLCSNCRDEKRDKEYLGKGIGKKPGVWGSKKTAGENDQDIIDRATELKNKGMNINKVYYEMLNRFDMESRLKDLGNIIEKVFNENNQRQAENVTMGEAPSDMSGMASVGIVEGDKVKVEGHVGFGIVVEAGEKESQVLLFNKFGEQQEVEPFENSQLDKDGEGDKEKIEVGSIEEEAGGPGSGPRGNGMLNYPTQNDHMVTNDEHLKNKRINKDTHKKNEDNMLKNDGRGKWINHPKLGPTFQTKDSYGPDKRRKAQVMVSDEVGIDARKKTADEDIEVGDRIKLIKTDRQSEAYMLGKQGTVNTLNGNTGTISVEFDNGHTGGYPKDCLKKISQVMVSESWDPNGTVSRDIKFDEVSPAEAQALMSLLNHKPEQDENPFEDENQGQVDGSQVQQQMQEPAIDEQQDEDTEVAPATQQASRRVVGKDMGECEICGFEKATGRYVKNSEKLNLCKSCAESQGFKKIGTQSPQDQGIDSGHSKSKGDYSGRSKAQGDQENPPFEGPAMPGQMMEASNQTTCSICGKPLSDDEQDNGDDICGSCDQVHKDKVKKGSKKQAAYFSIGDKVKVNGEVGEITDIDSKSVGMFGDVVYYKMKYEDGTEKWETNLKQNGIKASSKKTGKIQKCYGCGEDNAVVDDSGYCAECRANNKEEEAAQAHRASKKVAFGPEGNCRGTEGDLVSLCENKCGSAVASQLEGLFMGRDIEEMNGNALKMIQDFLSRRSEEEAKDMAEEIQEHFDDKKKYGNKKESSISDLYDKV